MMIPKTPFAMHLSRSGKETEVRIRYLFQKTKKRPPVWLMTLTVLACLLCGSLVSCQQETPEPDRAPDASSLSSASTSSSPDQSTPPENIPAGEITDQIHREGDAALLNALLPAEDLEVLTAWGDPVLRQVADEGFLLNGRAITACIASSSRGYVLAIGLTDQATGELLSSKYTVYSNHPPKVIKFWDTDEKNYILYTANSLNQGYGAGEAGLLTSDGESLQWTWPVEGDILAENSPAYTQYQEFWDNHLALMAPGGVDLFVENPGFSLYDGTPAQWEPENGLTFFPSDQDLLYIPEYIQVRRWLDEFTRNEHNPYHAKNTSALWAIRSLLPVDNMEPYDRELPRRLFLLAESDVDNGQYLAAFLTFDPYHDGLIQIQMDDFAMGDWATVMALRDPEAASSPADQLRELLLGKGTFLGEGGRYTLATLSRTVTSDYNLVFRPVRFAVLDLDQDGTNEVVLDVQNGNGYPLEFVILRVWDGQVYGYNRVSRAFQELKADGTYSVSSSAFEGVCERLTFERESYTEHNVFYHNNETYTVDGKPATQAEWESAVRTQDQKPDAAWYDFTPENVNALLRGT